MVERIRALDWEATHLGPSQAWPQPLRTAVEMMLASPMLATLAVGPERVFLYNDMAARHYGDRHPDVLGRPLAEAFAHEFADVASFYDRVFSGESLHVPAQALDPSQRGTAEIFDAYLTPVRDVSGDVIAAHMTGFAVGGRLLAEARLRASEERQAFLLSLSDMLRPVGDPVEVQRIATRMLGQHLNASRVFYVVVGDDGDTAAILNDYTNGVPSRTGRYSLTAFSSYALGEWRAGRTASSNDVNDDPRYSEAEREAYASVSTRAGFGVPLIKEGRLVALLGVNQAVPRRWSDEDIGLAGEVAERTWTAVERAHAEAALRESEARLAATFESVPAGLATIDLAGHSVLANAEYRRFLPTGIVPSRDPERGGRWKAWDEDGRVVAPSDYPAARALRGERVIPGLEMLHVSDDGRDVWTNVATVPTYDNAGRITGVVTAVSDIDKRKRAEAALRASEAERRSLIEQMSEGFCILEVILDEAGNGLDYRFLETNPAFVRQGGFDPAGRLMSEIAPIEPVWPAAYGRVARTGTPERIVDTASSFGRFYDVYAFRIGDAGDHRIAVFFTDITKQNSAEEALRESEERFRQFGEASQDVLWIRNAETFQWEYLTPAFETIYGLDRATALSGDNLINWLDLVVPDDREHAVASLRRVRDGEWVTFEFRIQRQASGEVRWLRNTDFPIRNTAGQIVRIGGIGHDVTELKHSEEALTAAELWQRALVEGIPQLVWRAVDGGEWTWASPQWTEFTGQSDADSRGWGWIETVHPDDRDAVRQAWATAIEAGGFETEHRIRQARSDSYRWFQTRATPVRNGGGSIVEWLGTCNDIDDLRTMQERQAVLVAELQHRTRNLMGVVRSTLESALRSSSDLDDFSDKFRSQVDALARVQRLLSRLNQDERVTFDALIRDEMAAVGALKQVSLVGPPGVALRSSTVQIFALALHELCTNALKYGALAQASGRLVITWRLETAQPGGKPWLHVDWHESGVDMSSAEAAPRGTGQGRQLIERALPYQLGAKTTYVMGTDGVRCSIAVPVSNRTAAEETDNDVRTAP